MATGIVSIVAQRLGLRAIAWAMHPLNLVFYCALNAHAVKPPRGRVRGA